MPVNDISNSPATDLKKLAEMMAAKGCSRLLVKRLSGNDNSKNQVYLGGSFGALNAFHGLSIVPATTGEHDEPIFKATLRFMWMDGDGHAYAAPTAQLILYPQYPEVRMSGFLARSPGRPSALMNSRDPGRILFLGLGSDGDVYGHVVAHDTPLAREFLAGGPFRRDGVFEEVPVAVPEGYDSRTALLEKLREIHREGWIDSIRLNSDGAEVPCRASNCGGYTLEALLGIIPNGVSEPDYLGWEVKQHGVTNFGNIETGNITVFTPEPKGGYYKDRGVIDFVMKYGYPDKLGRPDRRNFGGIHRYGTPQTTTGLTLSLLGYDASARKITDPDGAVALVCPEGEVAASWPFQDLLEHWNRKHAHAVYVPSKCRAEPSRQYTYGDTVRLCERTDFMMLLGAIQDGAVYYDPGIKVERVSTSNPNTKRRSQFRIRSAQIPILYDQVIAEDVA